MVERNANQEVTDDSEEVSSIEIGAAEVFSGETVRRTLVERQQRYGLLSDEELDAGEPAEGTLRKEMGPEFDDERYDDDIPSDDDVDTDNEENQPAAPPSDA